MNKKEYSTLKEYYEIYELSEGQNIYDIFHDNKSILSKCIKLIKIN